jgi:demethylmenaquinone methyltransferase/2-methoxy-6-polyprenyl-1,4-benzoquinol methylase
MAGPRTKVWDARLLANPHAAADKPVRVRCMFAAIARSYDLNNRLHSLWLDQLWRRRAVALAELRPGDVVLDIACGTGDLALAFARALDRLGGTAAGGRVVGMDFTAEMLPLARAKAAAAPPATPVAWAQGDAQHLPLDDDSVDVVGIAFGIRNVASVPRALAEFHRVLRPGGRLVILECALPRHPLLRALYNLYFRRVLPVTATLISGDRTGAYRYLPESVNTFADSGQMLEMLAQAGFADTRAVPLTAGVCVCYAGRRADGAAAGTASARPGASSPAGVCWR